MTLLLAQLAVEDDGSRNPGPIPLLIVVLGVIIGGMVISLYLPIFTLYGELAQQG